LLRKCTQSMIPVTALLFLKVILLLTMALLE
jgi:hypothetical protein